MAGRKEYLSSSMQKRVVFSLLVLFVALLSFPIEYSRIKTQTFLDANIAGESGVQHLLYAFKRGDSTSELRQSLSWFLSEPAIKEGCVYGASLWFHMAVSSEKSDGCPQRMEENSPISEDNLWFDVKEPQSGVVLGGILLQVSDEHVWIQSAQRSFIYFCVLAAVGVVAFGLFHRNEGLSEKRGAPSIHPQFNDYGGAKLSEREISERLLHSLHEMGRHLEQRNDKIIKENDHIKASNQRKNSVIAHATHELRNPLHAIVNFSDLSLKAIDGEKNDAETIKNSLRSIRSAASKIVQLVSTMMDISKIDNGIFTLRVEKENLLNLLSYARSEIVSSYHNKNVDLVLETGNLPKGTEACDVYCDAFQIGIVLSNILSNALTFTPKDGKVTIEVSTVTQVVEVGAEDKEAMFAKITVSDTGMGFSPNETSNVFEPFHKGSNASFIDEGREGLGLGLSLSKEIVQAHKGIITASNNDAGGAVVSFTLPMEPVESDDAEFVLATSPYLKYDQSDMRKMNGFSES